MASEPPEDRDDELGSPYNELGIEMAFAAAIAAIHVDPRFAPMQGALAVGLPKLGTLAWGKLAEVRASKLAADFNRLRPMVTREIQEKMQSPEYAEFAVDALRIATHSKSDERIKRIARILSEGLDDPDPELEVKNWVLRKLDTVSEHDLILLYYLAFIVPGRRTQEAHAYRAKHGALVPGSSAPLPFTLEAELMVERFRSLEAAGFIDVNWAQLDKGGNSLVDYPHVDPRVTTSGHRFMRQLGIDQSTAPDAVPDPSHE